MIPSGMTSRSCCWSVSDYSSAGGVESGDTGAAIGSGAVVGESPDGAERFSSSLIACLPLRFSHIMKMHGNPSISIQKISPWVDILQPAPHPTKTRAIKHDACIFCFNLATLSIMMLL